MAKTVKGLLLVAAQLGAVFFLVFTGPILPRGAGPLSLLLAGLGLGGWAVATMLPYGVRVAPEPGKAARLVMHGPYRWIRHPMYTALLLLCLGWLLGRFNWMRLLGLALLAITLVVKLRYEERLLTQRFPGYADYRNRSSALVPYLF